MWRWTKPHSVQALFTPSPCIPEGCTFEDPELHEMTRRFSRAEALAQAGCCRGAVLGASHAGLSI